MERAERWFEYFFSTGLSIVPLLEKRNEAFKKILLLAGNTAEVNETLERAVELAQTNEAQLTVVDVLKETPGKARSTGTSLPPSERREMTPKSRLETLITPVKDKGVRIDCSVLTVKPDGFVTPVTI